MDWELIFWCVLGGLAVPFMLRVWLPWNERHDNNPYRYCPKEEDEQ